MEELILMDDIIGTKIKCVRTLTDEEANTQKWNVDEHPMVIELENDINLYVCNEDMTGPGTLWGYGKGKTFASSA